MAILRRNWWTVYLFLIIYSPLIITDISRGEDSYVLLSSLYNFIVQVGDKNTFEAEA